MFDIDKWQEIANSMWQHKLRTILTSFGVSWGIFMLVFLMGAGQGLQNGVYQNFSGMAKNSLYVWAWKTSIPYGGLPPGRYIELDIDDLNQIENKVEGVEYITPRFRIWGTTINRKNKTGSYNVSGVNQYFKHVELVDITKGRHLNERDVSEKRKVIVIGKVIAENLFPNENPIEKYLQIQGAYFQIIGVFKSKAFGEEAKSDEEMMYMPYTSLQQTFNKANKVGNIVLTILPGFTANQIETQVLEIIKTNHVVSPDDDAIGTWSSQEEFEMFGGLFFGIKFFIWLVGIGTIFAGVIGVSNIMMIIVKDRTREIGIRKALGATPGSIIGLILMESVVVTSISGFLGLLFGVFLITKGNELLIEYDLQHEFFTNPEVNIGVALTALVVLIISGMLAGLIPALKAASVNPIEALRTE